MYSAWLWMGVARRRYMYISILLVLLVFEAIFKKNYVQKINAPEKFWWKVVINS